MSRLKYRCLLTPQSAVADQGEVSSPFSVIIKHTDWDLPSCMLYHSQKQIERKNVIFSYPSVLTYGLGAQKNRLIGTLLLSTHNICFG